VTGILEHLEFVWTWALLALPLPWLIRMLLPAAEGERQAVLRTPFLAELEELPGGDPAVVLRRPVLWPAVLAWLLLVIAAARPQWVGDAIEQSVSGRDLMLAVDLSGSMEISDFVVEGQAVDRLTATKSVAGPFIDQRVGDRLGLILFGDKAYLQVPLTFDRKTVRTLLDEAAIGLAGEKTAIGDAIGLAVKRLRGNPQDQRVLILLSDGANTAGEVQPLQAAELAAQEGLKIYTIGVGADELVVRDFFGSRRVNPSQDLDEPTMRAIAERTGGHYFRARDTAQLAEIYGMLDRLEPVERDKRYFRPRGELFPWPLGAALTIALLLTLARILPARRQS